LLRDKFNVFVDRLASVTSFGDSSVRVRRSIIWFAIICLLLLTLLTVPSGQHPRRVPPEVAVQGLSRTDAEFLYGHVYYLLRNKYWDALRHLNLKEAWFSFQEVEHTQIQRLTKNPDGSASILVVQSWPGKVPFTNTWQVTGNWSKKETQ